MLLRLQLMLAICAVLVCADAVFTRAAQAEPRRVALIAPGDELLRAARAALEPWQLELVVVDEPSPGASAPHLNEVARELAQRYGASALIWVSEHVHGYALWVYDAESGRVIERPLRSAPPFDGPTAAAVALSIKTLLRHSASAPEAERYGAPNAAEEPAVEAKLASPAKAAAEQASTPNPPSEAVDTSTWFSPFDQPRRRSRLDVEIAAGIAVDAPRAASELSRFGLGALLWPSAGAFGLGLALRTGPSARIDESMLEARLLDTTIVLAAELRARAERAFRLSAGAGFGLHVVSLDGRLPLEAMTAHVTRVAPSGELELRADWLLASELFVGVRADLSALLRTERYFARTTELLALARFGFGAGLAFGFALPE